MMGWRKRLAARTPSIDQALLRQMASGLSPADAAEQALPSYLHPNPLARAMAWRRVGYVADHLARIVRTRGGDVERIIDFGCGAGVLLKDCARLGRDVVGIDPRLESARLLTQSLDLPGVRLLSPNEADAGIEPASVDAIVAMEVLEHIGDLAATLATFRRWLAPEGRLLVSLPTENLLYRVGRRIAGFSGHYHRADAASVHRAIVRTGFVAEHLSKFPLGGPLSLYWVIRYGPPPGDAGALDGPGDDGPLTPPRCPDR